MSGGGGYDDAGTAITGSAFVVLLETATSAAHVHAAMTHANTMMMHRRWLVDTETGVIASVSGPRRRAAVFNEDIDFFFDVTKMQLFGCMAWRARKRVREQCVYGTVSTNHV
jgi:hypothetical protein